MEQLDPGLLAKLQDPRLSGGGKVFVDIHGYRRSVARDLEDLLNVRLGPFSVDLKEFPWASKSVLALGVSDFSNFYFGNLLDLELIASRIRGAIELFESRLSDVMVAYEESVRRGSGLSLTISAVLIAPGISEQVKFDAFFDMVSKKYEVGTQ